MLRSLRGLERCRVHAPDGHSPIDTLWQALPERGDAVTAAVQTPHGWTRVAGLSSARLLDIACIVALVALLQIIWSMVDPKPVPFVLAAGQVLGTMSIAVFLLVVVRALRWGRATETKEGEGRLGLGSRAAHPVPDAPPAS